MVGSSISSQCVPGEYSLRFHRATTLTKLNPETGSRDKRTYGPWIFGAMRLLALKRLRGTPFDFCGWSGERRMERKLAADYIDQMTEVAQGLTHDSRPRDSPQVCRNASKHGHVGNGICSKRKPSATPF